MVANTELREVLSVWKELFLLLHKMQYICFLVFYFTVVEHFLKTAIRMVKFEGHLMVFHVKAMWLLILL